MATGQGTVLLPQDCGPRQVEYVRVDDLTPMQIYVAVIRIGELFENKRRKEGYLF